MASDLSTASEVLLSYLEETRDGSVVSKLLISLLDVNIESLSQICNRDRRNYTEVSCYGTCMAVLVNVEAIERYGHSNMSLNQVIITNLSYHLKDEIKSRLLGKIGLLIDKIENLEPIDGPLKGSLARFLNKMKGKCETQELGGRAVLIYEMLNGVSQVLSSGKVLSDRDSWKGFFDGNHNRFKGTENDYSFNPDSIANKFCIDLAVELTPPGKSFIKTLLPEETQNLQDPIMGDYIDIEKDGATNKVDYDTRVYSLDDFFLGRDGYINLYSGFLETLKQKSKASFDLESQKFNDFFGYWNWKSLQLFNDADIRLLKNHSPAAFKGAFEVFYDSIKSLCDLKRIHLYGALEALRKALEQGDVYHDGNEHEEGADGYAGIIDFNNFFKKLDLDDRTKALGYTTGYVYDYDLKTILERARIPTNDGVEWNGQTIESSLGLSVAYCQNINGRDLQRLLERNSDELKKIYRKDHHCLDLYSSLKQDAENALERLNRCVENHATLRDLTRNIGKFPLDTFTCFLEVFEQWLENKVRGRNRKKVATFSSYTKGKNLDSLNDKALLLYQLAGVATRCYNLHCYTNNGRNYKFLISGIKNIMNKDNFFDNFQLKSEEDLSGAGSDILNCFLEYLMRISHDVSVKEDISLQQSEDEEAIKLQQSQKAAAIKLQRWFLSRSSQNPQAQPDPWENIVESRGRRTHLERVRDDNVLDSDVAKVIILFNSIGNISNGTSVEHNKMVFKQNLEGIDNVCLKEFIIGLLKHQKCNIYKTSVTNIDIRNFFRDGNFNFWKNGTQCSNTATQISRDFNSLETVAQKRRFVRDLCINPRPGS